MAYRSDRREPVILPARPLDSSGGLAWGELGSFGKENGLCRMAGDWIKMEHDLPDKPEVVAVADKLGVDRFSIVGRLHRLWSWFDRHTQDGNAPNVTPAFLNSLVALDGFASALESVGWLSIRNGSIAVPNFDRHISKSAKHRALGRERVKRSRNDPSATKPLPEKRREEKNKEPPQSPLAIPPPLDTSQFREAWQSWITHRREIKYPLKPTQEAQQIKLLAHLGAARSIELIEYTIAMGWRGLRDKDGKDLTAIAKTSNGSDRLPEIEDERKTWSADGAGGDR